MSKRLEVSKTGRWQWRAKLIDGHLGSVRFYAFSRGRAISKARRFHEREERKVSTTESVPLEAA